MKAMFWADHIHLRCPGNIGLLGCIAQMAFPGKVKTAKYAGNWDPKAKQPLSYRLQRSILSNTFLTRKMQVLVYGKWNGMTKNIQPFFTATYHESDKMPVQDKKLAGRINFIFAGTLVAGKNPLYAVQLAEILLHKGHNVALDLYGEGPEKAIVLAYIKEKQLENNIYLKNNQTQEILKEAFQECHFVILPSASEGWPKVIAEGMFWGAVPLASAVSCVPYMLDYGKRGILLTMDLEKDILQVEQLLQNENDFQLKRTSASKWSRAYTLDVFETRIKQLLQR
jgi:glycosyltransferase involved in cell wall biosynthesis